MVSTRIMNDDRCAAGRETNGQLMGSIDLFRTRSYAMQPVGTVTRGIEWMLRSLVGSTPTYEVYFGAHRFKLKLQSARRGFGSAGIFVQATILRTLA
jgi:hypothetical protein